MRMHTYRALRQLIDAIVIFASCSLAYWVRFGTFLLPENYLLPSVILAAMSVLALQTTSIYDFRAYGNAIRNIRSVTLGIGLGTLLTALLFYMTQTGDIYSRIWFGLASLLGIFFVSINAIVLRRLHIFSSPKTNIIVLGNTYIAKKAASTFNQENEAVSVRAHYADTGTSMNNHDKSSSNIFQFIEEHRLKDGSEINEVWIAHDVYTKHSIHKLEKMFGDNAVSLVYLPDLPGNDVLIDPKISFIQGIPTIGSDSSSEKHLDSLSKLAEDKIIAGLALLLLSPIICLIGIIIKLDSAGPIIYKQSRYGVNGRIFDIYKFRTMTVTESSDEFVQATTDDPRITRFGKFLRKTSLDELPQLVNVLAGDMSIVGPRPHPKLLNENFRHRIDGYMTRHRVKPGITGLAQINGFRGETAHKSDMENRIKYDLEYIRDWNVILDLKIILKTIGVVFKKNSAY